MRQLISFLIAKPRPGSEGRAASARAVLMAETGQAKFDPGFLPGDGQDQESRLKFGTT